MPDTCTCLACGDVASEIHLCELCGRCAGCADHIEAACGHELSPDHDDAPPCECGRCERCCICPEGYIYA
jgi:hypothetical protein